MTTEKRKAINHRTHRIHRKKAKDGEEFFVFFVHVPLAFIARVNQKIQCSDEMLF